MSNNMAAQPYTGVCWYSDGSPAPWKALVAAALDWLFDGYERFEPTLTLPEIIATFFLQPGEEHAIGSFLVASLTLGGSATTWAVRSFVPCEMEREPDLFDWAPASGLS